MSSSLCIELNNYSNERVYFYIYGILQVGSELKGYIGHKRIIFFEYNDEKILTVIKNQHSDQFPKSKIFPFFQLFSSISFFLNPFYPMLIFYQLFIHNSKMNSENSSIRQIYEFPIRNKPHKARRNYTRMKKPTSNETNPKQQTFDKFVRKTKNVVLFAQKLKQRIAKKHILNMQNLSENELQYLQKNSQEMEQQVWFSKDSRLVFTVQILFVITLLVFVWKKSFQIVFSPLKDLHLINSFTLLMYIIYGLVFCMSQYKNERQETINSRHKIKQIYLKQRFLSDLIVSIMILFEEINLENIISSYTVYVIIRMIAVVLAYQTIRQLSAKIEDSLSISTHTETTIAITRLLFKIFLFLHFLSILLNSLAKVQHYFQYGPTWIQSEKIANGNDLSKYIQGWYWGATILSTVGFGDIVPANNLQRFCISIVQVFCCMTFGYFVNVIGTLIRLKADRDEKYEKQNRSLNRYLNFLTLSQQLKFRIRTHFFNKHIIDKTYDSGQQKIVMQNLSLPLKTSLLQENNLYILKKCNHFQKMKDQILNKLALNLKRVIFAPQHLLYSRQSRQKKMWIIESGAVEEFTDNFQNCVLKKKVSHFEQPGCAISWINFLLQKKYTTTAKACKFTVAYELQHAKFVAVLQEDPKQWHKILGLKQFMTENRREYVQKCLSCDRYTHNAIQCPRIHYIRKDPYYLIQQSKNFHQYLSIQGKKNKYQRSYCSYKWKINVGQNLNPRFFKRQSQQVKSLDHTIDNFIKHMNKLNSLKQIANSNKKISPALNKLDILQHKADWPEQLINKPNMTSSIPSLQDLQQDIDDKLIDKVLLGNQNQEFMPQHNVEEVINSFNRYLNKLIDGENPAKIFSIRKN